MIDKSWMLNPQAIRHAKTCIQIVKERTNQKLKLSQVDFFHQLEEFAKKVRSVEFSAAHHQLMSMADSDIPIAATGNNKVVPLFSKKTKDSKKAKVSVGFKAVDSVETVAVAGKHYPKWQAGKAFQGLYRGQPHYQ